jgi:hypothetical protein
VSTFNWTTVMSRIIKKRTIVIAEAYPILDGNEANAC